MGKVVGYIGDKNTKGHKIMSGVIMKTIRRKINLEGMIGNYLNKSKLSKQFHDLRNEYADQIRSLDKEHEQKGETCKELSSGVKKCTILNFLRYKYKALGIENNTTIKMISNLKAMGRAGMKTPEEVKRWSASYEKSIKDNKGFQGRLKKAMEMYKKKDIKDV